jgi:hypothetical protein
MAEDPEDATSQPTTSRPSRKVAMVVAALLLVGAGVGVAVGVSSGVQGSNTPATAVNALLTAAHNDDLIGVLDAIAPGERSAIEPGMVTFVHQLQRLDVLSSSANLDHVTGLSFSFNGIETSTRYLDSSVAAVTITNGSITSGADPAKLPLGSFVTSLAGGLANKPTSSKTQTAKTGKSSIVTVDDNGSWYVSLGYTIAVNALASSGAPATLPSASSAITPVGAATPQGAVTGFLNAVAAFNLNGLIADLAPGEMGALQRFAPLFMPAASAELSRVHQAVQAKFTNISTSTKQVGALTLVRINKIGLQLTTRGVTVTINGRCNTVSYQGHSKTTCTTVKKSLAVLKLLPADVRALVTRLDGTHPDSGVMTTEENGKWFISPVATILQSLNSVIAEIEPQDLTMIANYAKDPAAAKKAFSNFEKALLAVVASRSSVV